MEDLASGMLNTKNALSPGLWLVCVVLLHPFFLKAQFLKKLVPDDAIVQYAGSIGFLSAGLGYDLFGNKRGSLDFNFGYVPKTAGGPLRILSLKFAYRPWKVSFGKWGTFYPLNPGTFLSYHFGKDYDFQWDENQYVKGYYWWSSALRPHLSFSNEVKLNLKKIFNSKAPGLQSISIYSEFNTNELYLISFLQNVDALSVTHIFKVGFGLRLRF